MRHRDSACKTESRIGKAHDMVEAMSQHMGDSACAAGAPASTVLQTMIMMANVSQKLLAMLKGELLRNIS